MDGHRICLVPREGNYMTTSERAAHRHSRRQAWRTVAALLAVFALIGAACGSDDGDDDASEAPAATEAAPAPTTEAAPAPTTEAAPSGEPIKVMTVTTLNAAGPTYHNIANTANAYADYINARGGIAGRPLEVTVCDEMFDPAVAAACAREAVEENMVAVIGSFTFFAESIVPVIAESDITWFGPCCPITPSELTSPHSFPIGNQPMYAVGIIKRAIDDGCQAINAVIIDGAQIFLPPMENAIAALGQSFGDIIILPPTAQDYSSEVAQATTDADCVIGIVSETPYITWNTAWTQSGTDARQYGPQGNLNEISAAGNEESTDGDIIGGMYPDISTAPWDEYRLALEEGGWDTTEHDYNSLGGMGTWAAYAAFTQIAETIDGEINASSFFQAASATDHLDLGGMVPVLDFTQEWTDGLPGFQRLFNRSVVFSKLENGKVVPLTTEFEDVGDLATGNAG
ncbi:MAG: ABC transporter substrate-binding protein [Acidimicrobiales bacterium]|nr:ABC transporter substrate-binding protein [Acidimicrobiales bacterium]MXY04231.1 ABC transporter substrate-binding protein [Acidimicrobiales bacterium]MXZ14805.1 ABC transporter substrate-binding protein [Acidimicrobiales bacterium]MYA81779.1 ABC transporter substrate-binding protein [Acidimicrobiales bacterium]MYB82154.1 ABC transporter substrate-binding protein [Acidimicrobiales bacterium]